MGHALRPHPSCVPHPYKDKALFVIQWALACDGAINEGLEDSQSLTQNFGHSCVCIA